MTIQITVIGNLTENPDLRYTNSGTAVVTMTVAVNERYRDNGSGEWKDGPTSFCRVNAWRDLADHAAESLAKGDRVMVYGTLRQRSYDVEPTGPKDSGKRQVWEVQATEIGAALRYAKVAISKVKRDSVPVPEDPWAREDQAPTEDKPPF
jgi:single-strand DNA-binding protein